MRKSMIETLFKGEFSVAERAILPSEKRDAVEAKAEKEKAYLKSQLSPENAQHLENLEELYTFASTIEDEEIFAAGVQFGVLLMVEVMTVDAIP